jgi:hypothetical protein
MIEPAVCAEVAAVWRENAVCAEGASFANIAVLEKRLNFEVPSELRFLLSLTDGYAHRGMDDRLFTFWKSAEWSLHSCSAGQFVLFGDFLIHSHEYGFGLPASAYPGAAVVIYDQEPIFVASSLAVFWRLYLDSPQAVELMGRG